MSPVYDYYFLLTEFYKEFNSYEFKGTNISKFNKPHANSIREHMVYSVTFNK